MLYMRQKCRVNSTGTESYSNGRRDHIPYSPSPLITETGNGSLTYYPEVFTSDLESVPKRNGVKADLASSRVTKRV